MIIRKSRLVPKHTHWMSRLTFFTGILIAGNTIAQDMTYVAPDVTIFDSPEQVFELPGSGEYIGPEEIRKYNFNNINDIIRNTPGVYSREETGKGVLPNISLRGTATLRSAQLNLLEDEINIAPAPYSAPDAYYAPITGKMHAIEILKGTSQYRYGPHSTGGAINYVTTPIDLGKRYYASAFYGSGDDVVTHDYFNYGVSGNYGAVALLGEMYYRTGGGRRDFNIDPTGSTGARKSYGSDELGDIHRVAPMVKLLWQLPTQRNLVLEAKYAYHDMNYNQSYSGQSTGDFRINPHEQYVVMQFGEFNTEQHTSYLKLNAELNDIIRNETTVFYNFFTRDWYKFDKIGGEGAEKFNSKAYIGDHRKVARGELAATDVTYVNNDRSYASYGVMNETDFTFNTNFFGKSIDHELKVGFKYAYDYIHKDQQTHTFSMANGGTMTQTAIAAKDDSMETADAYVGYFEEKMSINNFDVMFGARYEAIEYFYRKGATADDEKEMLYAFAPGGGLVYNHDDNWQWFAGVYKGFNVPGPSAARDGANNGNPVDKETSIAKEIGARYNDPNWAISVVGFHTDFKDLIVLDNSNSDSEPENAGNVVTKGIELSMDYLPPEEYQFLPVGDLSYYLTYTFTNANLDGAARSTNSKSSLFGGGSDGSNVPYIPDHRLAFGIDYDYNKFDFGARLTYQSESYGTATETETEVFNGSPNARAGRIDSYTLLHFVGGYDFNDNFRLQAGVNNATDLEYIATRHPSGARAGAPLTAYIKGVARF